jgi:DNA-binding NarL/FixJ family response regulator
MVRVFVADDHEVVRRGMQSLIAELPDMVLVGSAADGEAAVQELRRLAAEGGLPDVVIMDMMMPRMDGVEATAVIRREFPAVEVVVLTSFGDTERVHRSLEAGAAGFLLKDSDADDVERAVRAALSGELHLDPAVARQFARTLMAPAASAGLLSPREKEVVGLVGRGLSNRQIADRLYLSERTARTHVSSILQKLGLASRTQAALWAVREGLADEDD